MASPDSPSSRSPGPVGLAPSPSSASGPAPRAGGNDDGLISFEALLGPASSPTPRTSAETIDLGSLVSRTDEMDAQVWMVQKDKLDHGPFSARELGQQIIAGKIGWDDQVLNMDSGVRQRCEVWTEFREVVKQARALRQAEEEAAAQRKVEVVEKRVGWLRYLIAAIVVVVIGIGVGSYFLILNATRGSGPQTADEFADLVAAGQIPVKTGAGILPGEQTKAGSGGRRRGGKSGGGGGGAGGLSAEEAMARAANYGDLSGGMTQLSIGQINSVMNRNARRFYPCLYGHRGRVTLDFVINGDGSVAGVTVPGASGAMSSCMASKMRSITFPSFGSPRMRASFFFEVGE